MLEDSCWNIYIYVVGGGLGKGSNLLQFNAPTWISHALNSFSFKTTPIEDHSIWLQFYFYVSSTNRGQFYSIDSIIT